MADAEDLTIDTTNDMQDYSELPTNLVPPPEASYPDKNSLIAAVQAHGKQHGYNVVIKTSSIPNEKKPGRAAKVWLRCDRGGTYRPRNGLTEETRKRKRSTRLMDCPFMIIASGSNGMWTFKVHDSRHNHGPVMEPPRAVPNHKVKRGQIEAVPYHWPHDASFSKFTTALVIIDMQRDCKLANPSCVSRNNNFTVCAPGGYLEYQGYDISPTQVLIPKLKRLLQAFRDAGFPIYHTREGMRVFLACGVSG
jgi:hypothetical protein